MRTLIIGGCGYIGTRLWDEIPNSETIDLEWFGQTTPNKKVDYRDITVDDLSQYQNIILVAGPSSEKMCEGDFLGTFNNNVVNFVKLLEKIRTLKHKPKFIYASSCRVYYGSNALVSKEIDTNFCSPHPYDISKYMNDIIMRAYPDINFFGLRFATVNGYSRLFRKESLINSMFCSAKEKGFLEIRNGHVGRAVLDMEDLVQAVSTIINKSDAQNGYYNLVSFNGTVSEIGNEVSRIMNCPVLDKGNDYTTKLNFAMDSSKFCEEFNFEFKGSVANIIANLSTFYKNWKETYRIDRVNYV